MAKIKGKGNEKIRTYIDKGGREHASLDVGGEQIACGMAMKDILSEHPRGKSEKSDYTMRWGTCEACVVAVIESC